MKKLILLVSLVLVGCATTTARSFWSTQNGIVKTKDSQEYRQCHHEALQVFHREIRSPMLGQYLAEETFESCMNAKGVFRKPI